jgi:hypothetical protein
MQCGFTANVSSADYHDVLSLGHRVIAKGVPELECDVLLPPLSFLPLSLHKIIQLGKLEVLL